MARILLLDPSETARRSLQGILARGEHKLVSVDTPSQAWTILRRNQGVDLVITELTLPDGNGLDFIGQLKADLLLKLVPVIVYTADGNRGAVRQAVGLGIQNFLIKPYHDDDIFAELDKALVNPWRDRHFEEEKSFCKMMGYTPANLHKMLDALRPGISGLGEPLRKCAQTADSLAVNGLIGPLRDDAEAAGAWCLVESLQRLADLATEGNWAAWPSAVAALNFCDLLIAGRADPGRDLSPDFNPQEEVHSETVEQAAWASAPPEGRCPLFTREQMFRKVETLSGCPVIASAAASFQMIANGHPSCINPLMDLVARDPGLAVQMLIAANKAHPPAGDDLDRIEDPRLAVGQLGEFRLEQQARALLVIEERIMDLPPAFNWSRYWAFQRGVARIAQIICRDLEFLSLEPLARSAAQVHDIGKLLLARLHPGGFRAILEHAREHHLPLGAVEKLFLGCTTMELAAHFADRSGLSRHFTNVMRWIDDPAAAPEDTNLVAIISLARDLCHHSRVGASGDPVRAETMPIAETAEWQVLRESVYPSFNLQKFESAIQAHCDQLRTEFSGHQAGTVRDIAARAAVS